MATKKEQGWYTAALGVAIVAAGVALDDPGLAAGGIGIAAGGVKGGLGGTSQPPTSATPREGTITGVRDPDAPSGAATPTKGGVADNTALLGLGALLLL